jgi:fatty acid amide hydrolase
MFTYFAALTADGGASATAVLAGGEVDPSLRLLRRLAALSPTPRAAAARVAGLAGQRRLRRLIEVTGEKSVRELWQLTHALRQARDAIFAAMRSGRLDVLLCPPHATAALPHGASRDFTIAGSPSMLWNLCQFPAGVVPVTRVRPEETRRVDPRDRMEKRAAQVDKCSAGLPVGVQVVGYPCQEHVVLAAMIAIEEGLAGEEDRPATPRNLGG